MRLNIDRWAAWVYRRRHGMQHRTLAWPVALAIVLLLHLLGGWWALQLKFNNAPEVYYTPDAPAIVLRDSLRRDFPSDEMFTVVLRGPELFEDAGLKRVHDAVSELSRHPLVDRVVSVLSAEKITASDEGFAVLPLIDIDRLGKSTAASRMREVQADRFAPGTIVSRDGQYMALAIRPKTLQESEQRLQLKKDVVQVLRRAGLERHYVGDAGPVTMDVAQLQTILRDTLVFVPMTSVLGVALLWWVVRRVRPVLIGALAMSTVVVPTVGAIAFFQQPYTMASAIVPSLLSAYAIATLMHVYAAIQRAQSAGLRRAQRLDRALEETRRPGIFNALTTACGMLSLALVPIPPVQVFGIAGAAGSMLVFFVTYVLVPALLLPWDKHRWSVRRGGLKFLGQVSHRITLLSLRHPVKVIVAVVAVMLACIPLLLKVQAESDLLTFFPERHPAVQGTRLVESKFMGVTTLELSLQGSARDSFVNARRLQAMRELQKWLEQQPEVDRTVSMVDLVEEMHWAMNGGGSAPRVVPEDDALIQQYLLVYDGRDLFDLVNRDMQHARVLVNLHVHGAHEIGAFIERVQERLRTTPIEGVRADVGGQGRLFADQINLLLNGQFGSFAAAFLQIGVLMALMFRSPTAAAVLLLPNLAPLYFVFVLMGASGIYLNMATVMIAGVVLGITVDDTIHLYHGYLERRRRGASTVFAIARSFQSSGRAVLAISVLLVSQFLLLTGSDYVPTNDFGLMTAVGLLAGQAFELLLLPALLLLKETRLRARQPSAAASTARALPVAVREASAAPLVLPGGMPTMASGPARLLVCHGAACIRAGAAQCFERLERAHPDGEPMTKPVRTDCLGRCEAAPAAQWAHCGTPFALTEAPAPAGAAEPVKPTPAPGAS